MLLDQLVTTALLTSVVSGCTGLAESTSADKLLILSTCKKIEAYISSASEIFYDGHPSYHRGIEHWASSSSQRAMCVFEPGSAEDVAIALQILGETRTPFAGVAMRPTPGFSSTLGVHISMTRFSDVTYNSSARTATVGAGMVWDDVYAALAQHGLLSWEEGFLGLVLLDLRLAEVGYSWLTEQYGLAVDNVEEYELVMPNGTIVVVSETSSPELFFGLKSIFDLTYHPLELPPTRIAGALMTCTIRIENKGSDQYLPDITLPALLPVKATIMPDTTTDELGALMLQHKKHSLFQQYVMTIIKRCEDDQTTIPKTVEKLERDIRKKTKETEGLRWPVIHNDTAGDIDAAAHSSLGMQDDGDVNLTEQDLGIHFPHTRQSSSSTEVPSEVAASSVIASQASVSSVAHRVDSPLSEIPEQLPHISRAERQRLKEE
ncbi:hypothetical protein BU15DRAFT_71655 [Melanogaster broomeanus]|nr:hypothetical protein BU15DRAFT_71655 [Melanogaster broomeanus]